MIQENIAINGNNITQFSQFAKTNHKRIELKAQATQKTLYWLEAKNEAIIQAQIQVIIH
jgi:hypothetical protein